MKQGETIALRRRIGPIRSVDENGDPVDTPDVEVSVNDGAFTPAGGTFTPIGDGYGYYLATEADASVIGFVMVKLGGDAIESTIREEVEARPQGISAGVASAPIGALRVLDENGDELVDLTGVDVQVTLGGEPWTSGAGALSLIEAGYADYLADETELGEPPWIAVRLTGACQEIVFRATIVDPSDSGAPPSFTVVSPTPGVPPGEPGGFPANRDEAVRTPIVLRVTGMSSDLVVVVQFFGSQTDLDAELVDEEMSVYRRGAFRGKHVKGSTADMDGEDLVLTIFREGGWQGRFIKFDIDLGED